MLWKNQLKVIMPKAVNKVLLVKLMVPKGDHQQQGKSTDGVGEQQNGTQTAVSTNGKIPTPANSGTGTATDEKAPQGDSTTNPVAKPDSENSAVKVQHAGTKEDAHY